MRLRISSATASNPAAEDGAAEAAAPSGDNNARADKLRHSVRKTFITKRLVNLFIKNMSAHDEEGK